MHTGHRAMPMVRMLGCNMQSTPCLCTRTAWRRLSNMHTIMDIALCCTLLSNKQQSSTQQKSNASQMRLVLLQNLDCEAYADAERKA